MTKEGKEGRKGNGEGRKGGKNCLMWGRNNSERSQIWRLIGKGLLTRKKPTEDMGI